MSRDRHRLIPVVALSAALLLAACGGGDDGERSSTASEPDPSPSSTAEAVVLTLEGPAGAKCMMPNAQALSGFADAFSGTVAEVDGNEAVLEVDHWYAGGEADRVVVQTTDVPISEAGLIDLREGKRYLISGDQGSVTLCGFSAPWSPRLERIYDEAFPS